MKRALSLFVFLLIGGQPLFAVGRVGNSGDGVWCTADEEWKLKEGFYTLDYLLSLKSPYGKAIPIKNWKDSLADINLFMKDVMPNHAEDFATFRRELFAPETASPSLYIWEPTGEKLHDIKDEDLRKKNSIAESLPKTCYKEDEQNTGELLVHLRQVMIQQNGEVSGRRNGKIAFSFDKLAFVALEQTGALQVSYLLLHEWLWKFSDNVLLNREITHLLHSTSRLTMSKVDFKKLLKDKGFEGMEAEDE